MERELGFFERLCFTDWGSFWAKMLPMIFGLTILGAWLLVRGVKLANWRDRELGRIIKSIDPVIDFTSFCPVSPDA